MINLSTFQYKDLSPEDALLAEQASLYFLLNDAYKVLFNVKGYSPNKRDRYEISKDFKHSKEELQKISRTINFILELIGEYSNKRFGESAKQQNTFFQRKYEQRTFFIHLFESIQPHKEKQIGPRESDGQETRVLYLNDIHLELKLHEDKNTQYFKKGHISYTEKQLYAAGVYYMIPFILSAIKEGDALYTSQLLISIRHFMDGIDYTPFLSHVGGSKSAKKRSKNKEAAYKIFVEKDIYKKCQPNEQTPPKKYLMAEELKAELPIDMKISLNTIKTDWIPEFVKRYERD